VASARELEATLKGEVSGNPEEPKYPKEAWPMAGMRVPEGGSSCESCKFLAKDSVNCRNKFFVAWAGPGKPAGSPKIPGRITAYCSIWYEPKSGLV